MFSLFKHKECFGLCSFTCPLSEYRSYSSVCLIPTFAAYSPPSSLWQKYCTQPRKIWAPKTCPLWGDASTSSVTEGVDNQLLPERLFPFALDHCVSTRVSLARRCRRHLSSVFAPEWRNMVSSAQLTIWLLRIGLSNPAGHGSLSR